MRNLELIGALTAHSGNMRVIIMTDHGQAAELASVISEEYYYCKDAKEIYHYEDLEPEDIDELEQVIVIFGE